MDAGSPRQAPGLAVPVIGIAPAPVESARVRVTASLAIPIGIALVLLYWNWALLRFPGVVGVDGELVVKTVIRQFRSSRYHKSALC